MPTACFLRVCFNRFSFGFFFICFVDPFIGCSFWELVLLFYSLLIMLRSLISRRPSIRIFFSPSPSLSLYFFCFNSVCFFFLLSSQQHVVRSVGEFVKKMTSDRHALFSHHWSCRPFACIHSVLFFFILFSFPVCICYIKLILFIMCHKVELNWNHWAFLHLHLYSGLVLFLRCVHAFNFIAFSLALFLTYSSFYFWFIPVSVYLFHTLDLHSIMTIWNSTQRQDNGLKIKFHQMFRECLLNAILL